MPQITMDYICEIKKTTPMTETQVIMTIERVLEAIATKEDLDDAEVSVVIVDDDAIRDLNRTYRQLDQPTDVLSFAMLEGDDDFDPDDEVQMLGDIVISWDRLCEQAKEYGHDEVRELAFLVAHGMLHLLGYDHQTKEDETIMFGLQEEILTDLGFVR
nr:rRNA maturation RNase YbeY [Bacilli bacterium]